MVLNVIACLGAKTMVSTQYILAISIKSNNSQRSHKVDINIPVLWMRHQMFEEVK